MAVTFDNVILKTLDVDSSEFRSKHGQNPLCLRVVDEAENLLIRVKSSNDPVAAGPPSDIFSIQVYKETDSACFGRNGYIITDDNGTTTLFEFSSRESLHSFAKLIKQYKIGERDSVFAQRTDDASATQYFQFYGYLSQQQNMMQDYIRTSTYQRAILSNSEDFRGKVVLDVGAGSGILSFFAAQAGARKVYAVEASSMAKHAETLVFNNKLSDRITVIPGKIEEIDIPEPVDVIISEPMGYMLFNERMLETYLHAKKWLAPNGKMFPSRGDLHVAPFTDAQLYTEQVNWHQNAIMLTKSFMLIIASFAFLAD